MVVAVFQESKWNYLRLFGLAQTVAVLFGPTSYRVSPYSKVTEHTPPLDRRRNASHIVKDLDKKAGEI